MVQAVAQAGGVGIYQNFAPILSARNSAHAKIHGVTKQR